MKKKIILILVIVLVICLIFGILYLIDMNRMENNKPVLFSTWGYDYAPPVGISNDYDLRYETSVVINNDGVKNINLLNDFINNTNMYAQDRKPSSVRILRATIEGDYIVTDLEYTSDDKYIVTIDNSKDEFAGNEERQKIIQNEYNGKIYNIVKAEVDDRYVVKLIPGEFIEFTEMPEEIVICEYMKHYENISSNHFIATVIQETDSRNNS